MTIRDLINKPVIQLVVIFFIIGIICVVLDVVLPLFGQKQIAMQNVLFPFVIGAISSFIVSILFIDEYFKYNATIKFSNSFGRLLGEIRYNRSMAAGFCLNRYIQQARDNWSNHTVYWIPEKYPSFTPWSSFFYQYLPVNAYYYFINQEFIIENRLGRGLSASIGRYYIACIHFSQSTQLIENEINSHLNTATNEQIEQACENLRRYSEQYLPEIEREYNAIMNTQMVLTFSSTHPELITYE